MDELKVGDVRYRATMDLVIDLKACGPDDLEFPKYVDAIVVQKITVVKVTPKMVRFQIGERDRMTKGFKKEIARLYPAKTPEGALESLIKQLNHKVAELRHSITVFEKQIDMTRKALDSGDLDGIYMGSAYNKEGGSGEAGK